MVDLNVWGPLLDAVSPGWRARQECASVEEDQRAQLLKWAVEDALVGRVSRAEAKDIHRAARHILANKITAQGFCADVRERYRRLVESAHVTNVKDKVRDQLSNNRGSYD
jgi:hypothetical protein